MRRPRWWWARWRRHTKPEPAAQPTGRSGDEDAAALRAIRAAEAAVAAAEAAVAEARRRTPEVAAAAEAGRRLAKLHHLDGFGADFEQALRRRS